MTARPGPKTLRQLAIDWATTGVEFIGTPEQVARKMGEAMEEIGGDGFLIMKPGWDLNRNYISSITDGLVPELQRLGLTRTEYSTIPPCARRCANSDRHRTQRQRGELNGGRRILRTDSTGAVPQPDRAGVRQYFQGTSVANYVAFGALAVMFVVAIFARQIAPYDPLTAVGQPMAAPNGANLLGTDTVGRDIFSRVLVGMQTSWFGALAVVAFGAVFGGLDRPDRRRLRWLGRRGADAGDRRLPRAARPDPRAGGGRRARPVLHPHPDRRGDRLVAAVHPHRARRGP